MSTFKVPVTQILDIKPIDGADKIELATIKGYQVVVQKGAFVVGDYVVYIPEDSIVPANILHTLNLTGKLAGPDKNRVKAIKLKGVVSQGIVLPTQSLDNETLIVTVHQNDEVGQIALCDQFNDGVKTSYCVQPDEDVATILRITKYDPPIPVAMAGEVYNAGKDVTVHFDVENLKSYPDVLVEGEPVIFTEKGHGTFTGIGILPPSHRGGQHIEGKFVIFSKGLGADGLCFKDNEANKNNVYLKTLREAGVLQALSDYWETMVNNDEPMFILGETYGGSVQKGMNYGTNVPQFRAFKIVVGFRGNQRFLDYSTYWQIIAKMGLQKMPVLYSGPFTQEAVKMFTSGLETLSGTQSHIREGIVIEPEIPRYDNQIGHVLLKSVSDEYLTMKGVSDYR